MHYPKSAITLCSLLLSLAACGEVVPVDGATVDASPGEQIDAMTGGPCEGDSIAIENLKECFIAAQCNWIVTCGFSQTTVEACILDLEAEGGADLQRTLEAVAAERTIYDGTAAATCLSNINCTVLPGENCSDVFVGTVADGELCYENNECAGVDADCRSLDCSDQCCPGSCLNTAPIGGDCSSRSCAEGAACVFAEGTSPNSQCYSGEVGVLCGNDYHCDDGLYCRDNGNFTGSCQPAFAENATCARDGECAHPLSCVGDFAGVPGTCRKVDMVNAPCDDRCEGNLFCEVLTQGSAGMCKPKRGLNGVCSSNSTCQPQFYCNEGSATCQAPAILNMPCESYHCAAGLLCTSELPNSNGNTGVCAQPTANGTACNSDSHCSEGLCVENVCEAYMSCYP